MRFEIRWYNGYWRVFDPSVASVVAMCFMTKKKAKEVCDRMNNGHLPQYGGRRIDL